MATVKELRKVYPNCMTAIGYVEMFILIPIDDDKDSIWDILLKEVNGLRLSPREVVNAIRRMVSLQLDNDEADLPEQVVRNILVQIDTPKFYQYIRGKMGAV